MRVQRVADPAGGLIIQPGDKRLLLFVKRFQRKIFNLILLLDFEVALGVAVDGCFPGMRNLLYRGMTFAAVYFAMGGAGIFGFVDMQHFEPIIFFMSHKAGILMTGETASLVKGKADRNGIEANAADNDGQN